MKAYLRVKVISLAAEAKIIRRDERFYLEKARRRAAAHKSGDQAREIFWGLRHHRILDVRREARSAQLAYGYLRSRRYRQLEEKCYTSPNWPRVAELVRKFGNLNLKPEQIKADIKKWSEATDTECAQSKNG